VTAAIRTRPAPECPLCGGPGARLYAGLRDHVEGAPGAWDVRRCSGPACGLLWLDPEPVPEDLAIAYRSYFSHDDVADAAPPESAARRLAARMKRGYLARAYGYQAPAAERWLGAALYLLPQQRARAEMSVMRLPAVPSGRLVEIGCGDGRNLELLARAGWRVQGVEPDALAAARARKRGLDVRVGSWDERHHADDELDAVVLCHVLEHVYQPVALLAECLRIVKPGGRVVVVTPNHEGWGHRRYGRAWRALDPPRHLRIFSTRSLAAAAARAGWRSPLIATTPRMSAWVDEESRRVARAEGQAPRRPVPAALATALGWLDWARHRGGGEELVLQAVK
jgi:SAM-dependent methyltransferase